MSPRQIFLGNSVARQNFLATEFPATPVHRGSQPGGGSVEERVPVHSSSQPGGGSVEERVPVHRCSQPGGGSVEERVPVHSGSQPGGGSMEERVPVHRGSQPGGGSVEEEVPVHRCSQPGGGSVEEGVPVHRGSQPGGGSVEEQVPVHSGSQPGGGSVEEGVPVHRGSQPGGGSVEEGVPVHSGSQPGGGSVEGVPVHRGSQPGGGSVEERVPVHSGSQPGGGAWRRRCQSIGVDVLYKFGGKLVGERTRRPLQTTVTELLFADAAVVVASEREGMERAAHVLDEVTTEWDLTMSLIKTKLLVVSEAGSEEAQQPIIIHGQPIEVVDAFKYLGAVMEGKGEVLLDVEDKIARASRAFGTLCRPVFNDGNLSRGTKRMVYRAAVLGVLLYGAET